MRRFLIEENHGIYAVVTIDRQYTSSTLEGALIKALRQGPGSYTPEVRNFHEAAELLESLLGPSRGQGQIHTGIVSS